MKKVIVLFLVLTSLSFPQGLGILGLLFNTPATPSYKVYTAILTQTGTNAPVATVLENTLGGTVIWTRDALGVYTATLSNAFTVNKTWVMVGFIFPPDDATVEINATLVSVNRIDINTWTDVTAMAAGELVGKAMIEIRVYP